MNIKLLYLCDSWIMVFYVTISTISVTLWLFIRCNHTSKGHDLFALLRVTTLKGNQPH